MLVTPIFSPYIGVDLLQLMKKLSLREQFFDMPNGYGISTSPHRSEQPCKAAAAADDDDDRIE
ncbi:hypothetical protein L484_000498 [Morus notabilis]|uniref:Uncharacterized protein n=1 Tax=Morus notabilis TaxID=981085 RepID=W9SE96_9ROSA|nr:hypothetical protein L484_000498 [Morus notabilis]